MDSHDAENGTVPTVPDVVKKRSKLPMANSYAAKKTMTQGMMDVALITANANQMKFILNSSGRSVTHYPVLVMLVASLLLQVAVGISLVFKGRCDLKGDSKLEHANRINNYVVVGVFLVTLLNVFIAAFGDTVPPKS